MRIRGIYSSYFDEHHEISLDTRSGSNFRRTFGRQQRKSATALCGTTGIGKFILDSWAPENRKMSQIFVAGPSCHEEKGANNMVLWVCLKVLDLPIHTPQIGQK